MNKKFLLKTAAMICAGVLPLALHAESAGENTAQGDANSIKDTKVSTVPAEPLADGVVKMKDGTYIIKDGTAMKVTETTKIAMGPTVKEDGSVMFADGKDMKLQEGQMVTFGGKILKAPSSIPTRGNLTGNGGENQ
jgi:hypothetical protein